MSGLSPNSRLSTKPDLQASQANNPMTNPFQINVDKEIQTKTYTLYSLRILSKDLLSLPQKGQHHPRYD